MYSNLRIWHRNKPVLIKMWNLFSMHFYISLAPPSAVSISISKNPINYGHSVTLSGSYSSLLNATMIKWQKQDNGDYIDIDIDISNYTESTEYGPNPKLVIKSVMFTDEANYTLVVSNRVGSTTSNSIQLDVTGGIIIFSIYMHFLIVNYTCSCQHINLQFTN